MVFSTCFNGYDAGIMTVILADPQFTKYYAVNATRQGIIATIPWATTGRVCSIMYWGPLASWVGRLWALRISMSVMIIGVIIQVVPNTYGVLILGRLVTGLGFGCVYIATNLYVAECAPRSLRGSFVGTVSQFGYQLGTFIAFWSGYGMSLPHLPLQHRLARLKPLTRHPRQTTIRHHHRRPRRLEFHELVSSHEYRKNFKTGYIGLLSSAGMRKRLAYGIYAMALQQFGGIAALTMYAAIIYKSLGWDAGHQAPLAINGIQAALQLVIVLVNTFTVDRFGRKSLLIAGFSIQSLALLVLSSLTTAYPITRNRSAGRGGSRHVVYRGTDVVGFLLSSCWSNGPVPPAIASEIFPQEVRDKGFGLSLLGQTVCLLALTQPWPRFNDEVGGRSYWLLFGLNFVALISVILILPETKAMSLERMDAIFGEVDAVAAGEVEEGEEKEKDVAGHCVEHKEGGGE
ncbi:hypothetical protein DID88_000669 [Monilinia fructigena]|uniref:Major facilitator superfamily (MFS) profile domain-containing protein n=1 Tax=Monilinia fructigena TaxID=38457 RepID=A0A395IKZ1_9HELO|nr:hypothetical protein DID88_000669 [Monilinia fructigena]